MEKAVNIQMIENGFVVTKIRADRPPVQFYAKDLTEVQEFVKEFLK